MFMAPDIACRHHRSTFSHGGIKKKWNENCKNRKHRRIAIWINQNVKKSKKKNQIVSISSQPIFSRLFLDLPMSVFSQQEGLGYHFGTVLVFIQVAAKYHVGAGFYCSLERTNYRHVLIVSECSCWMHWLEEDWSNLSCIMGGFCPLRPPLFH